MNTQGLTALTVPAERLELIPLVTRISGEARAKAAELRGHRIVFAFFQSDFNGGFIPYWHVTDPTHKSYHSTLSFEGLKQWNVI